jgi:hypothetical protein
VKINLILWSFGFVAVMAFGGDSEHPLHEILVCIVLSFGFWLWRAGAACCAPTVVVFI